MRRLLAALVLAFAFASTIGTPRDAAAARLEIGLGASYWLRSSGVFDLDFEITAPLASVFSVGGRFGVAITTGPTTVAAPIDLVLHFQLGSRFYLEGLVGPWIFFESGRVVAAHVALGFGLEAGSLSFGPEVGYLDPSGLVGVKLAFRL